MSSRRHGIPGSPAFYAYRNHNRIGEVIASGTWTRNRHVITAGAGLLLRGNDGYLTAGRDGQYIFSRATNFAFDRPSYFRAAVDRLSASPTQPSYDRNYSYAETYLFAQDSYRVNNRLTLNYGARYERYRSPANTGVNKDTILQLGTGSDFTGRLAASKLVRSANGDQSLYGTDSKDFAIRTGFSYDPAGTAKPLCAAAMASSTIARSTTFGRTSATTA